MITPILEKLLLKGFAKNKIYNCGFGMFNQLQIPDNSFIVIHKIFWNGFLNQKNENIFNLTWKQFFEYNEYQLKIQSDKESPLYYIMRNDVNFDYFNNFDPAAALKLLNQPIQDFIYDDYILMRPKKPVIFDTFITAYDYLNFTISRNSLLPAAQNFSLVNSYANEKPNPEGVDGSLVLLDCLLKGTQGQTQTINPPGVKATAPPLVTPADNTPNYKQSFDKQAAPDNGSYLNPPLGGFQLKYTTYVNQPLVSFEYCVVSKHAEGYLSTL